MCTAALQAQTRPGPAALRPASRPSRPVRVMAIKAQQQQPMVERAAALGAKLLGVGAAAAVLLSGGGKFGSQHFGTPIARAACGSEPLYSNAWRV